MASHGTASITTSAWATAWAGAPAGMVAELGGAGGQQVGLPGDADQHVVAGPRPRPGRSAADAGCSDDADAHRSRCRQTANGVQHRWGRVATSPPCGGRGLWSGFGDPRSAADAPCRGGGEGAELVAAQRSTCTSRSRPCRNRSRPSRRRSACGSSSGPTGRRADRGRGDVRAGARRALDAADRVGPRARAAARVKEPVCLGSLFPRSGAGPAQRRLMRDRAWTPAPRDRAAARPAPATPQMHRPAGLGLPT